MSKIQITELKSPHSSSFNILNEAESAEVLGGSYYNHGHYGFDFSSYISSKFNLDIDLKDLKQIGKNGTYQIAFGGKKYNFAQYKHGSHSYNYAFIK